MARKNILIPRFGAASSARPSGDPPRSANIVGMDRAELRQVNGTVTYRVRAPSPGRRSPIYATGRKRRISPYVLHVFSMGAPRACAIVTLLDVQRAHQMDSCDVYGKMVEKPTYAAC
jgi:hypothetical protein